MNSICEQSLPGASQQLCTEDIFPLGKSPVRYRVTPGTKLRVQTPPVPSSKSLPRKCKTAAPLTILQKDIKVVSFYKLPDYVRHAHIAVLQGRSGSLSCLWQKKHKTDKLSLKMFCNKINSRPRDTQ